MTSLNSEEIIISYKERQRYYHEMAVLNELFQLNAPIEEIKYLANKIFSLEKDMYHEISYLYEIELEAERINDRNYVDLEDHDETQIFP